MYALSSNIRATDINPKAASCTSETAKENGRHVCCVITDLVCYQDNEVLHKVSVMMMMLIMIMIINVR